MATKTALKILAVVIALAGACRADVSFDLKTARIVLDDSGHVSSLQSANKEEFIAAERPPAFEVVTASGIHRPKVVKRNGNSLTVEFDNGGAATFEIAEHPGFVLFDLKKLEGFDRVTRLRSFSIKLREPFDRAAVLNACYCGDFAIAAMGAEINLHCHSGSYGAIAADRPGCTHTFKQETDNAKAGTFAARFAATSTLADDSGYSLQGTKLEPEMDLAGIKAVRAWVHGDGKGQFLKIQLTGQGGYRDDYVKIDFTGWRQVTFDKPAGNTIDYAHVQRLNFYFNALPAKQTVECLIDHVEAILNDKGVEKVVVLEDFEDPTSVLWQATNTSLCVDSYAEHGIEPVRFGVIACSKSELVETIQRFEQVTGLPAPRPGGVWSKTSPWTKRSYFFLTRFSEDEFDEALAIARRGGFDMILIGQESWCKSTGHYIINPKNFPDGLPALQRTIQRFKDAGFKVGLHFLGPSIYPPDPYLTPRPDPRLVRDASATLAADIDDKMQTILTTEPPKDFPEEDGGYKGIGSVIQIGDELIWYATRTLDAPCQFIECRRGMYGTKAAPHKKGDRITHLRKSYGYFLFDIDTSLLDEVATNFATVANTCGIDMIYFDGSERLQGGHDKHWYYNAKFQKAFYDKLKNKDTFIQGSSWSHISWHIHARSASADGHGDLKGYLDERSNGFIWRELNLMPMDVGWYYGYDPTATLDQYEYILGATIAYDQSMSFQVSPEASAANPIGVETLDLIARYEKLRLSGRVSSEMKGRMKIDPALAGVNPPEERAKLLDKRREYRLMGKQGEEAFQRVSYGPAHAMRSDDPKAREWAFTVRQADTRIGVHLAVNPSEWLLPGISYTSPDAIVLETFDDVSSFSGGTLHGVTQTFESTAEDARMGPRCVVYTAASSLHSDGGWAAMGKSFDPPLDISKSKAIGFWLRGDGQGNFVKLQLTDGSRYWDNYITNSYTGWRYQQIVRPEVDPIDFADVKRLTLYFNALPKQSTVCCGIDDIKALPAVDEQAVLNPRVVLGGKTIGWKGPMKSGQWLLAWPGEAVQHSRDAADQDGTAPDIVLPPGEHQVRVEWDGPLAVPLIVRITQQPPERHPVGK